MAIDNRFYELAAHLWRGGKFAYYWTPDDGAGTKYTNWLTLPSGNNSVPRFMADLDSYFGVNPSIIRRSEHERAHNTDVIAVNGFYCEFDCPTSEAKEAAARKIRAWQIPASCVVDSGGGYHVYILLKSPLMLDTPEKRKMAADMQWAFAQWAGGDTSVNDLARVLRIPGTTNHKAKYAPNYPIVTIVEWRPERQYELSDLEPLLQPIIDQRAANKAHTPSPPSTVSLSDQQLLDVLFASKNGDMYRKLWAGDLSPAGGDHSKADQMLCNGLAWLTGRDEARIDSLFQQSGLHREKWGRDAYRQSTISNAVNSAQTVYDPTATNGIDADAVAAAQSAVGVGGPTAQQADKLTKAEIDQILLALGANDEGNAQSVRVLYGDEYLWCEAYGYMYYNGRYWQTEKAEAKLKRAITNTLERRAILGLRNGVDGLLRAAKPNANNVKNCLYMFQPLITTDVDEFDDSPDTINCKNGVVDLRTGAVTPHDSNQRYTYCLPVDYDPYADYVPWVEFLARVVSHPEMIDYLQMAAGYTMTGHTREECLFYIHGPTRSGKGTFAETLLQLLTKPLGVQADFSTFTEKRDGDSQNFDLAPLKPARFVVASESNKYDVLNEAKIKTATGGDWIRCAFKHKSHFEYKPQFKIWLLSNHPVKGDVDDDAFWGRVKVIEFPNSFLGKEDKTLKARMKDPETLRGVLRWMIEGAIKWFAAPTGLNPPQAVIDATAARRRDLDYVQQWLDECCKDDPNAWTSNHDMRTSYENWCKQIGTQPKGPELFARALSQKGYATGIKSKTPLGKWTRGAQGLSII